MPNWKNKDDTTVYSSKPLNHILRERERENKMGLFDALPPLASASLKAKVNVKEDDEEDTRHTEKKRKIGDDEEEKLKGFVVKSSVSSMDDRLEKLSKLSLIHI